MGGKLGGCLRTQSNKYTFKLDMQCFNGNGFIMQDLGQNTKKITVRIFHILTILSNTYFGKAIMGEKHEIITLALEI